MNTICYTFLRLLPKGTGHSGSFFSYQRVCLASTINSYQRCPTALQNKTSKLLLKPYSTLPPSQDHHETVIHRLKRIERSLKIRGYSVIRIGAGLIVIAGFGVYLFRDHLRQNVAEEVSTVATLSLEDEGVQLKVEEVSKALLHAILKDTAVQEEAVRFFKSLLQQPGSKEASVQLLLNVLNDPVTQRQLLITLKQLIARSLSDPTFRHNIALSLKDLFDDPVTRDGIAQLMIHILQDESIKAEAKTFATDVLVSTEVTTEATKLAKTALVGVVGDDSVQKKTGDGLWSAFTYSIKPSWSYGHSKEQTPAINDGQK